MRALYIRKGALNKAETPFLVPVSVSSPSSDPQYLEQSKLDNLYAVLTLRNFAITIGGAETRQTRSLDAGTCSLTALRITEIK